MADINEDVLAKEIEKILKNADLSKISTKKVIQTLEKSFGVDLSKKKRVIDQLVMDYVNKQGSDEEDGEEEEEEEEEEEVKKRVAPKRSAPASKESGKKFKKESSEEDEEDATNDSESEEEKKKPAAKKGKKRKGSNGDSDSDWGKKEKAAKSKKAGGRAKGGSGSGYTRAYKLSPELAELMGEDSMPRHEVVKRVWSIIKEKKLYDPNNKQFAICDDALYKVFGIKRFRTFGMMKYLKTHFIDE